MREIDVKTISKKIEAMCIKVNYSLSQDVETAILNAKKTETSERGQNILSQLADNLAIAKNEAVPICQDTGMAVVFLEIGQDVHFTGGNIEDAVNEGVKVINYQVNLKEYRWDGL